MSAIRRISGTTATAQCYPNAADPLHRADPSTIDSYIFVVNYTQLTPTLIRNVSYGE